jgi:hypothetical protein
MLGGSSVMQCTNEGLGTDIMSQQYVGVTPITRSWRRNELWMLQLFNDHEVGDEWGLYHIV